MRHVVADTFNFNIHMFILFISTVFFLPQIYHLYLFRFHFANEHQLSMPHTCCQVKSQNSPETASFSSVPPSTNIPFSTIISPGPLLLLCRTAVRVPWSWTSGWGRLRLRLRQRRHLHQLRRHPPPSLPLSVALLLVCLFV